MRFLFVLSIVVLGSIQVTGAQSTSDLQGRIDQRQNEIRALEKEIAGYAAQINELNSQANSLSATIKSLDLTRKKLEADIKVTEKKIADKTIDISRLGADISDKEETIDDDRRMIAQAFRTIGEYGDRSIPELMLAEGSLSGAWDSLERLNSVQNGLVDRISQLQDAKTRLETNKKSSEKAKAELMALNKQLKDQREVVLDTVAEKNSLLKETKNDQAAYAQLLKIRQEQKDAFEREVYALEAALRIAIDPDSLPRTGSGVLSWPLDTVRITQYFGNTPFASANPQVYKGSRGEHNGIDLGAIIGTPVKAAAAGTVSHTFTTASRLKCGYGNWISIDHPNGLTTLYSHMSLNTARIGDQIYAGQVIGYSGNTGYTTGPHLHFGVYATQGFKVTPSQSCPGIMIPYAPLNAYLNPLSYLR